MSAIKFRLKTDYVRKDGTCALYAQVHVQGVTVKLPTEILLEPFFWDNEKMEVKALHPDYKSLNIMIGQTRSNIFEIQKRYMLTNRELTAATLKAEYKSPGGGGDFILWMRKEIDNRGGEIYKTTQRQHRAFLGKLEQFRKTVMFSELTPDFINDFQTFLRTKRKNNIVTVANSMKILKTYVHIALRRELIERNPFDHVKVRKGKPTIVYLTEKERDDLMNMYKGAYTSEKHKKVLLPFLFACFTGLRISDIKRLRWENIINDTIYITPFKTRKVTGETVIIPLGKTAIWLLSQIERKPRDLYVFDMISEQRTNDYLKEIADLVGIRKSIHFHVSRHTFATLFYEKTNDLATLQKLLGHASVTQTMVYAHVSDQLRRDQMKVFDA
jgi:integrase/recombinase XerD